MDQARNPLVNESDTTATKSQNNTIYDIAAATNSIEIESSTSRKSSHTNAGSTNGTNAKKARLRKGKWTIEEEEYTSRIIQYFSTGLLILPNGATLRSYLADKLNCDPMRITKKFTGACCLGRRAYHLRDRPRASSAEVEMANFELLHLERRFWLRVEHEQTGLPLPPWHELLASQPPPPAALVSADVLPSLFSLQQQGAATPVVKANNIPWIQHNSAIPPKLAPLLPSYPGFNLNIPSNANTSSLPLAAVGQLLLGNSNERAHTGNPSSAVSPLPQLQVLNNIIASLAFSQALTNQHAGLSQLQPHGSNMFLSNNAAPKTTTTTSSIYAAPTSTFSTANFTVNPTNKTAITMPVLSSQEQRSKQVQLYQKELEKTKLNSSTVPGSSSKKEERTKQLKAAFEEQQRALRLAYEKSLRDAQEQERKEKSFCSDSAAITSESKGKATTVNTSCNSSNSKFIPDTTSPAEQLERSYKAHLESLRRDEQKSSIEASSKLPPSTSAPTSTFLVQRTENGENKCENQKNKEEEQPRQEKTTDEEAGTILLGFLNSLRESFEDAVEDKNGSKTTKGKHNYNNKNENVAATKSILTANNIESSTVVTGVSSDLCSRNHVKRNGNKHTHSHVSANVRRQSSDPITSLSHFQTSKRKTKPASVTETSSSTSSQPTIEQSSSSQEDSKSDKMGNSSSEESSEKETTASRRTSKGPPRKRLKGFHEPHEFTRENLMAHSKRMDMECEESGCSSSSSDE